MPRTTPEAVKALLLREYDVVDVPSLAGFIATANVFVNRCAAAALEDDIPYTTEERELTERWLSAHCYQANDPSYTSRGNGGASGSFMWAGEATGFNATRYGNMAVSLDPTGTLNEIGKQSKFGAFWGGKTEPDRLTYDERN